MIHINCSINKLRTTNSNNTLEKIEKREKKTINNNDQLLC